MFPYPWILLFFLLLPGSGTGDLVSPLTSEEFWTQGYGVWPGVFQPGEILRWRETLEAWREGNTTGRDMGSVGRVHGWVDFPGLETLAIGILDHPNLRQVLETVVYPRVPPEKVIFANQSTICQDCMVDWHKDYLIPPASRRLSQDYWTPYPGHDHFRVVLTLVYLQDHSVRRGPGVRPGTAGTPNFHASMIEAAPLDLSLPLGSLLVLDPRITHRGTLDQRGSGEPPREVLTLAWGPGTSKHTQAFAGAAAYGEALQNAERYSEVDWYTRVRRK